MDALKKIFPLSFKFTKDVPNLIIGIIVQILAIAVFGLLIGFAGDITDWIPLVGDIISIVVRLVSSLLGLYCLVGIIIQILVFAKVIK